MASARGSMARRKKRPVGTTSEEEEQGGDTRQYLEVEVGFEVVVPLSLSLLRRSLTSSLVDLVVVLPFVDSLALALALPLPLLVVELPPVQAGAFPAISHLNALAHDRFSSGVKPPR